MLHLKYMHFLESSSEFISFQRLIDLNVNSLLLLITHSLKKKKKKHQALRGNQKQLESTFDLRNILASRGGSEICT